MKKEPKLITKKKNIDEETMLGNDEGTKMETVEGDDGGNEISKEKDESNKQTRRSERIKKQRVGIHPDDRGDNDDMNDKNYK